MITTYKGFMICYRISETIFPTFTVCPVDNETGFENATEGGKTLFNVFKKSYG